MSVTFYISEAPDHTVDCVYCEGAPGQDEHCLCKGTAKRIMMRLQATATLNRFNGSDYWVARCEQLIALIGWARENNHDDIQWA